MASPKVQHVSKAASDKLLVKFSDVSAYDFVYQQPGVESPRASWNVGLGSRKNRPADGRSTSAARFEGTDEADAAIVSWKTPLNGSGRRSGLGSQLRSVGGGLKCYQLAVTQIKTYGLLSAAADKAWRKALRGASRCFMEKHTAQAVRLRKEIL